MSECMHDELSESITDEVRVTVRTTLSSPTEDSAMCEDLTVMSYNVHSGIGDSTCV